MKKTLAIAGILALSITPTPSFTYNGEPKWTEMKPGGNLHYANLRDTDLRGVNLRDARMSRTNLSNANLTGTNFSNAILSRANFIGVDFNGANLSGAKLRGADLSYSNLHMADLTGADLSNIKATHLRGCPSSLPSGWFCEIEEKRPGVRSLIQR